MKRALSFVALLIFSVPAAAAELDGGDPVAATLSPEQAPIARVVLHPEHAVITRRAEVQLAAGRQVVRFTGLPMGLDRSSLRVGVQGAGELLAVHARTTWAEDERNALVAEIVPLIEATWDQLRPRRAALARVDARLAQLERLSVAVETVTREEMMRPAPDLGRVGAALDGLRSELPVLLSSRRIEAEQVRALEADWARLRQRLDQVGYPEYGAATQGLVRLESARGGRAVVELSYGIAGASWTPRYQLRTQGDQVELVVQADVVQSTGEDWIDVGFAISTASPKGLVPAPAVPRSVITTYEREDRGRTVDSSFEDRSELDGRTGAVNEAAPRVRVRGTGFAVEASEAATVRADGRSYRIVLVRAPVDGQRDLYAAPELDRRVVRRVRATNGSGLVLLPGPADVFADSGFIGTIRLEQTGAGAPLAFALGVQEGLTVQRELNQARLAEVELGLKKKVHYDVRVTATNTGAETREFVVEERIPVSRLAELSVALQDETSPGYTLDSEQGFVSWTVQLKPGEEQKLRLYYVLVMPRNFDW